MRSLNNAARSRLVRGQETFRHDTFGDEQFWTDTLRMHEVIESDLDPLTALSLGLKVDADALPDEVLFAILNGDVDLLNPQTTLVLLQLDAVVGVKGTVVEAKGQRTGGGSGVRKRTFARCALARRCYKKEGLSPLPAAEVTPSRFARFSFPAAGERKCSRKHPLMTVALPAGRTA